MSSTAYAKRSLYKPIDFFFRGVCDAKTRKTVFVDAFQILNDRYLGRMNVCNYFYVAENSVRINELNVIALDELKNYHLVMRENFYIPEKVVYSLPLTTRFLESDKEFEILSATLKENGYKKGSLVLGFGCGNLVRLDADAKKRYDKLRRMGFKTYVYGFGEEFNSLDIFAKLNFDYLRTEAAYFDASPAKKKVLTMLVRFCNSNKIGMIMEGVDSPGQLNRFRRDGVKLMTGKAVSKLSRWVTNELLTLPEPSGEQKDKLAEAVKKAVEQEERREAAETECLRAETSARMREDAAKGRVTPGAPRPELMKSPYQVRLERQKAAARRAAKLRQQKQAANAERITEKPSADEIRERRLMEDAARPMFEGEIQSILSAGSAADEKVKIKLGADFGGKGSRQKNLGESAVSEILPVDNRDGGEITADFNRQTDDAGQTAQDRLQAEAKGGKLDDALSLQSGFGGFGVTLKFENREMPEEEEEEPIVGHYNEEGQWVDEEGYVYNGYFDEKGEWQDYESFDATAEGSYNEYGQWVDKEGNVYDGYFDEEGRWIDYTMINAEGETVDNGYFDETIQKWIPFGYFDNDGNWIEF